MIEALAQAGIPTIPVRVWHEDRWRKQPLEKWDDATTDCEVLARWERKWPEALPGVPLERAGWVAIDLDDYSDASFREVWVKPERVVVRRGRPVREPEHYSIYATPSGGRHIIFAQPDPPVSGRMRWSAGVEVLGIGTLLTVYDANAILYPRVAQRAVLPEVFRKPYGGSEVCPINKEGRVAPLVAPERGVAPSAGAVASLTEALFKLDVTEWCERHDEWLSQANGCKFEGISEDDFVAWSLQDEMYRRDERIIRRKWHSLTPRHGGALWAALSAHGIKVRRGTHTAQSAPTFIDGVPTSPRAVSRSATKSPSLQSRSNGLIGWLSRNATGDGLFSAACLFAEMGVTQEATAKLVNGNLPSLRRALGAAEFTRQIARAYARIEGKQNTGESNVAS